MIVEDLKFKFKFIEDGDNILKLTDDNDKFNAYVIKDNGWYGVALEVEFFDNDYLEKFENVMILTKIKNFNNTNHKLLEIVTDKTELYEQFSIICNDFLQYISDDEKREMFKNNPQIWLEKWKDLLGNSLRSERNYSFLAELVAINHLIDSSKNVVYDDYGTHDIETDDLSFEVKSTIERYNSEIHISGQHQLKKTMNKDLKIFFIRLEESSEGYSILDLKNKLDLKGYVSKKIDRKIANLETIIMNKKYKVLEAKLYKVDDDFPKIIPESFVGGNIPKGIVKLEYVVDLNSLKCENINLEI